MKQLFKGAWVFVLLTVIAQASCKKTDSKPVTPIDVETAVQNKNWKLTALTVSPAIGGVTDLYNDDNFFEDCNRNDLYLFNPSNIFAYDEGPTTCFPDDPQTQYGTWSYTAGTKILRFQVGPTGMADIYDLTVTQITDQLLKGTMTDTWGGVSYTSTWTFTRQ